MNGWLTHLLRPVCGLAATLLAGVLATALAIGGEAVTAISTGAFDLDVDQMLISPWALSLLMFGGIDTAVPPLTAVVLVCIGFGWVRRSRPDEGLQALAAQAVLEGLVLAALVGLLSTATGVLDLGTPLMAPATGTAAGALVVRPVNAILVALGLGILASLVTGLSALPATTWRRWLRTPAAVPALGGAGLGALRGTAAFVRATGPWLLVLLAFGAVLEALQADSGDLPEVTGAALQQLASVVVLTGPDLALLMAAAASAGFAGGGLQPWLGSATTSEWMWLALPILLHGAVAAGRHAVAHQIALPADRVLWRVAHVGPLVAVAMGVPLLALIAWLEPGARTGLLWLGILVTVTAAIAAMHAQRWPSLRRRSATAAG
ncbi:hypothetical protein BH23ACT9_BH23ACT9_28240 [soil metagenome]